MFENKKPMCSVSI